jgi:hypothetical protein
MIYEMIYEDLGNGMTRVHSAEKVSQYRLHQDIRCDGKFYPSVDAQGVPTGNLISFISRPEKSGVADRLELVTSRPVFTNRCHPRSSVKPRSRRLTRGSTASQEEDCSFSRGCSRGNNHLCCQVYRLGCLDLWERDAVALRFEYVYSQPRPVAISSI